MSNSFKLCSTHFSRGERKILQGGFRPHVVTGLVLQIAMIISFPLGGETRLTWSEFEHRSRWSALQFFRQHLTEGSLVDQVPIHTTAARWKKKTGRSSKNNTIANSVKANVWRNWPNVYSISGKRCLKLSFSGRPGEDERRSKGNVGNAWERCSHREILRSQWLEKWRVLCAGITKCIA